MNTQRPFWPFVLMLTLCASCTGELEQSTLLDDSLPGGAAQGPDVPPGDETAVTPKGPPPGLPGERPEVPAKEGEAIPPVSRLVRLDQESYLQSLAVLIQGRAPDASTTLEKPTTRGTPFDWINPLDRFSTTSSSYGVDQNDFAVVVANARWFATEFVETVGKSGCFSMDMGQEACQRALLGEAGSRLYRRPLGPQELASLMEMRTATEEPWSRGALEMRLQALLLSPDFLFRTEFGQPGEPGSIQPLTPQELASALSFTLVSQPPDELLHQAVVSQTLQDDAVYAAHIDRLLEAEAHKARVKRFLQEFWRYGEAENVAKDHKPKEVISEEEAPGIKDVHYAPEDLVRETDRLIGDLIEDSLHHDFLATLLTTPKGYISQKTAIFYNLSSQSEDPEAVEFDSTQRKGLMMQPSWLVAFSEPDHNSPIRRGLFMQESLLCGVNPRVPIEGVPPLVISSKKSLRETLAEHLKTDNSCGGCHLIMDPLAFPFEQFNDFGFYRTEEAGRPVEVHGTLRWSAGEFDESGDVADPYELVEKLARSEQVKRCFIRHAFEFWMGRPATVGDKPTLETAHQRYNDSGGDFDQMLKSILLSTTFRERTLPE